MQHSGKNYVIKLQAMNEYANYDLLNCAIRD
jgi:hypothetical protein